MEERNRLRQGTFITLITLLAIFASVTTISLNLKNEDNINKIDSLIEKTIDSEFKIDSLQGVNDSLSNIIVNDIASAEKYIY